MGCSSLKVQFAYGFLARFQDSKTHAIAVRTRQSLFDAILAAGNRL
jgi:hypothetical protein